MGSDWLQLIGTTIIGVFSSFLVANLIAIVTAVKDDKLTDAVNQTGSPASNVRDPVPVHLRPAYKPAELSVLASTSSAGDDSSVMVKKEATLGNGDGNADWVDVRSDLDEEDSTSAISKSSQVQVERVVSSEWIMF